MIENWEKETPKEESALKNLLSFKTVILLVFVWFIVSVGSCIGGAYLQFNNLLGGLFGSGTTTVNINTVLESVQSISHLTTTRYTYSMIITSERDMPPLIAALYGERMVMVATGHVTAGVDLGQLTEDNIDVVGDSVVISLPAPTLQDCFFNEHSSHVVSRDTGIFARPLANLDTRSRQLALQKFRDDALEQGILENASIDAELALQEFVSLLPGIESVNVVVAQVDENAPLPDTCR